MDSLTLLKSQHSKLQEQCDTIREELNDMNLRELELENTIVKLTTLIASAIITPKLLKTKRKKLITTTILLTLLVTGLITSIVAGIGYTLENGFKINEIITAMIASSSISANSFAGLAIRSYKNYNKSLIHDNPEDLQTSLDDSNNELNNNIDKYIAKERELKDLEYMISELIQQINVLSIQQSQAEPQQHLDMTGTSEENQKNKTFYIIKKN